MNSKSHSYFPFLTVVALVLAGLACGSSNSGNVVGTSSPNSTSVPTKVETYKVGDVVQVKDQTITLNLAQIKSGILTANFTIVNQGGSDLNVSSLLSFDAKDFEGTKL